MELLYRIWLTEKFKLRKKKAYEMLDATGSAENVYNLSDEEYQSVLNMFQVKDSAGNIISKKYAISEYADEGLQAFVVNPENNKNAYVLLTNRDHSGAVVEGLMENKFDFTSFYTAKDTLKEHATVIELHSLNKHILSDLNDDVSNVLGVKQATLTTVNQGQNYEKFLVPVFDVYKYNGSIQANIKTGAQDLYSSWMLSGGKVIEETLASNFETATKILRRTQDRKFQDLSAPSSYRAYRIATEDATEGVIKRLPNYHPSDFLQAYTMNLKGIKTLLGMFLESNEDNPIKEMLEAFNNERKIVYTKNGTPLSSSQYQAILDSSSFFEFYVKNLFSGSVKQDIVMANADLDDSFDKSIFGILHSTVKQYSSENDYGLVLHESVLEKLNQIDKVAPYIDQRLSETSTYHYLVSVGAGPGSFNVNAGLYSTMRPLFNQQNRPLYFDLSTEESKNAAHAIVESEKGLNYI